MAVVALAVLLLSSVKDLVSYWQGTAAGTLMALGSDKLTIRMGSEGSEVAIPTKEIKRAIRKEDELFIQLNNDVELLVNLRGYSLESADKILRQIQSN
jgi:hypothetical protein